jgi:hypothetical protein
VVVSERYLLGVAQCHDHKEDITAQRRTPYAVEFVVFFLLSRALSKIFLSNVDCARDATPRQILLTASKSRPQLRQHRRL